MPVGGTNKRIISSFRLQCVIHTTNEESFDMSQWSFPSKSRMTLLMLCKVPMTPKV